MGKIETPGILLSAAVLWVVLAGPAAAQTTELSIAQTLGGTGLGGNGNTYVPGQTLEITITFTKTGPDPVMALGFTAVPPQGWTFAGLGTSNNPAVYPQNGADGPLEFAWITAPAFPAAFSFSVNIPAEATEEQCIDCFSSYRLAGGLLESNHVNTCLTKEEMIEGEGEGEGEGEPGGCHCAKGDFKLEDIDRWLGDFMLAGMSLGVLILWGRGRWG